MSSYAHPWEEVLVGALIALVAENEVISHCGLLKVSGDVIWDGDSRYRVTGSTGFESLIRSLEPEGDLV